MNTFKSQSEFRNYFLNKKIKSQNGQDVFVLEYFNYKRGGIFVDVGSYDGISFSNTYILEKNYDWNGICIEPIFSTFEKLNKNRNCIKLNCGISDRNSIEKFVYLEKSSKTLSGILKDYHPKHLERIDNLLKKSKSELIEVNIECRTINDILTENNINNVDYMSIDTEGNEFNIIKSLDFNKFNIKCISVENNYNNIDQTQYILSKKYKLIGRLGSDEMFIKQNE